MIDYDEFLKILNTLAALYPRFTLNPATIEAYYGILSDLPLDLLRAATLELATHDSPWFPSAGQIRTAAFRLVEHRDGLPTAAEAWAEARRVVGDPSLYYPGIHPLKAGDFSHPLVYEAAQAIGAMDIMNTPETSTFATRARFMDAYKTMVARAQMAVRMLPGVREAVERLTPAADAGRLGEGGGRDGNV